MSPTATPAAPAVVVRTGPRDTAPSDRPAPTGTVAPSRPVSTTARLSQSLTHIAQRASNVWVPRLAWTVARTGRTGQIGLALLAGCLVFLVSTHVPMMREVDALRTQLDAASAQGGVIIPAAAQDPVSNLLHSLPARAEMPALMGVILKQANAANLTIDTGKYEATALKAGHIVRYQISFPVTGPYPQVRQFIDATLTALPAVAVSELSVQRKNIGEGAVEAQIRLNVFTRDTP